jgi:hypothetical protein
MNPLVLVLLAILPIAAFAIGVTVTRMNNSSQSLSRRDRWELQIKRELVDELTGSAGEHVGLGDTYAVIVSDTLREHRRLIAGWDRKEIS